MPGIKGYEAVRIIHNKERFKHIPIVMVTSNSDKSDSLFKSYEAGAVDFVMKPVDENILINKVSQFIALDEQRRIAEESTAKLNILLDTVSEGILGVDLEGVITFANPKAMELLSLDEKDFPYKLQNFIILPEEKNSITADKQSANQGLIDLLMSKFSNSHYLVKGNLKESGDWLKTSGESFHCEYSCQFIKEASGNFDGAVLSFKDITHEKENEKKLVHLANFDYLTNISNRSHFHLTLKDNLQRAKSMNTNLAVMCLDIDHFKFINDQYGHDIGDLLLKNISNKLTNALRAKDMVARMGGDEFAIILQDVQAKNDVVKIAQKLLKVVSTPFDLNGILIEISTSIGIAFYEPEIMSMDDLMKAADTAMYEAKSEGRNNFQFFAKLMQEKAEKHQRIQRLLSKAISNNELTMVYQPKISLVNQNMAGCEALIRWKTDTGEVISPNIFIPIAEQSGQIIDLGNWIIDTVCQQVSFWQTLPYFNGLITAINVSVRQLGTSEFREHLVSAMRAYAVKPEHIEIEVTETATFDDRNVFFSELEKIHALGVKISIDDFGTGHSSLDYLRKMPVDIIKIDQSFIKDIGEDEQDEELIRTILAISKTMSIEVIAEGTETLEQLSFLELNHVDSVQGYFFSKPVEEQKMTIALRSSISPYIEKFKHFEAYKNLNTTSVVKFIGQ